MENKRPKRRKDKYNPYTICTVDGKNYIEFLDGQRRKQCVEISTELLEAFNTFELEDLKELNIYDRHIEHSELYESTLEQRSQKRPKSAEDEAVRNLILQKLYVGIKTLPERQRRRLVQYYFHGLTYEQIAERESCSRQAIMKSVRAAEEKLKKFLK